MKEKRKQKRYPIQLHIEIDKLFKQFNEVIVDIHEPVDVINVSKTGAAFACDKEIPEGFCFNARLEFSETDYFYCVLKIIRIEEIDGRYLYGCEFVGLAELIADDVEAFCKSSEDEK